MAPDPTPLLVAIFLPFVGAVAIPFVYRAIGERTAYVATGMAAVSFLLVASLLGSEGLVTVQWIPSLGIALSFYVDGLALLIAFLASGIGVLILAYSGGYMHGEPFQPKYYATLLVFMGSMLGVAFAGDLIALFLFWELTSFSSFVLIGHYQRDDASKYAARKAFLITVAGGLFMLIGFVILHVAAGHVFGAEATYNIATMMEEPEAMQGQLREMGLFVPVLLLLGVGAAAKSAQAPLHIWLPNAMEAPTPVSAFLHAATMVKAGVYLVGRFRPLLTSSEWGILFVAMGLITMTVTAILAVAATDIKELLAYSTASHLGLIIAGFGFTSELGAETGAFHILNHGLFKAALFLVAGIVAHEAGTRDIRDLGGLREDLPITAGVTAVAALGMAGVPPFNGFYSKELLFEATVHAAEEGAGFLIWLLPAIAVFGSVFTFMYSIKFLMLFFGDKPKAIRETDVHRPPLSMLVPPAILAAIAGIVGLAPQLAVDTIIQSTYEAAGGHHAMHIGLPTHLTPAFSMSVVTITLGVVGYQFYDEIHRGLRRFLALGPTTANYYYDGAVDGLNHLSRQMVAFIQTGLIRTYATWVAGAFAALTLGGYAAAQVSIPSPVAGAEVELAIATVLAAILAIGGAYALTHESSRIATVALLSVVAGAVGVTYFVATSPTITFPVVLVLALASVGAFAVGRAPSHIAGVLTLSILGFMVAIFYILASAPDLALTQLVVETLVLVIFLLVIDKLPAFYGELEFGQAARDAVLSTVVGITVFLTVLVSTAGSPSKDIYETFVNHGVTIDQAGGHNIVNVILVDFRAFDTMGEISVIALAALSVLTIIGMRERGETS
jgi:multicomponent Na+:H+ antiporter subunit A